MTRLSLLLLLIAPLALAADIDAPKQVAANTLVRVSSKQDGSGYAWWILATDARGQLIFADVQKYDGDKSLVFTGPPGVYQIMLAVSSNNGKLDQGQATVVIGGTPVPVPPGPDPPIPPEPDPPDPTPSGLRSAMLIHESADKTPAWAITINQLRTGPQAKYLSDRKTRLDILDDESLAGDARWSAILTGLTLPAVIVTDSKTRTVLHKQAVPLTATADEVLAIIKAHGG